LKPIFLNFAQDVALTSGFTSLPSTLSSPPSSYMSPFFSCLLESLVFYFLNFEEATFELVGLDI